METIKIKKLTDIETANLVLDGHDPKKIAQEVAKHGHYGIMNANPFLNGMTPEQSEAMYSIREAVEEIKKQQPQETNHDTKKNDKCPYCGQLKSAPGHPSNGVCDNV